MAKIDLCLVRAIYYIQLARRTHKNLKHNICSYLRYDRCLADYSSMIPLCPLSDLCLPKPRIIANANANIRNELRCNIRACGRCKVSCKKVNTSIYHVRSGLDVGYSHRIEPRYLIEARVWISSTGNLNLLNNQPVEKELFRICDGGVYVIWLFNYKIKSKS